MQYKEDKVIRRTVYWSRSLIKAEKNYTKTEREFLAIVWAFLTLRTYLEGQCFTICTDHFSFRWVLSLADSTPRLKWWKLRLLDFDFEVLHRAGIKYQAADALSRVCIKGSDKSPLEYDIPGFLLDTPMIRPEVTAKTAGTTSQPYLKTSQCAGTPTCRPSKKTPTEM